MFGQNSAFFVSLTIYIELDGCMRFQNDARDEADNLLKMTSSMRRAKKFEIFLWSFLG